MTHKILLKRAILALAATVAIAAAMRPAAALDCIDADPNKVQANVLGDFEFTADPNDSEHHLIYVNHVMNGPSNIVVARLNGITGIFERTLTTIADNFQGNRAINGPEFFMPPGKGLGVLYRALDGVHGVFRPATPKSWNEFKLTVDGTPTGKNPPALVSTYPRSYETGGLPLGQNTYTLFEPPCSMRCFASVLSGVPTDAAKVFEKEDQLTVPSIESLIQAERDYVIYAEACTRHAAANGDCGIYEATIDGKGGFEAGSMHELLALPPPVGPRPQGVPLAVGRHPVTGTTVFFLGGKHESGPTVDVYEEKKVDGPLNLLASVPVKHHSDHYRIRSSPTELIDHFLIRGGNDDGSYIISVTATKNGQLQVGESKMIAPSSDGSEVEYMPAAGKFVFFYRSSRRPSVLMRCFITP